MATLIRVPVGSLSSDGRVLETINLRWQDALKVKAEMLRQKLRFPDSDSVRAFLETGEPPKIGREQKPNLTIKQFISA